MLLSPRNLAHFLLERGLVTPESVVDGDFSAFEMSRRNRNFRVFRGPLPALFVKQAHDWEPFSTDTLRREATCYLLARDDPEFAPLAAIMPRFHDFDAQRFALTVEFLPAAETMVEVQRRAGTVPPELAARLGSLLGACHRRPATRVRDAARDAAFPRGLPWILNVRHHNPTHTGPVSAGARALADLIGKFPAFGAPLDAVRDGWRREALIHGDVKWENCLVSPSMDGGAPELRIVDWELADFGDPCWDAGSVFQAFLSSWLLSIRQADRAAPGEMAGLAELPLERMQPAIGAFWSAYAAAMALDPPSAAERLRRSTLYAAARMIQTAWEYTAIAEDIAPNVLALLQVAMNVLTRPDEAIVHLLGIGGASA